MLSTGPIASDGKNWMEASKVMRFPIKRLHVMFVAGAFTAAGLIGCAAEPAAAPQPPANQQDEQDDENGSATRLSGEKSAVG